MKHITSKLIVKKSENKLYFKEEFTERMYLNYL